MGKTLPRGRRKNPPRRLSAKGKALTRNDARLINLDTGQHVDGEGKEHQTSDANPAHHGPVTLVIAHSFGHPPMLAGEHRRLKTNVHHHLERKRGGHPHPMAAANALAAAMGLPRGRSS